MPADEAVSKVPEIIFGFWVVKIVATTLGATGGDWVTMSLNLGYLVGGGIFAVIFIGLVAAQANAGKSHPFLYWATIVATTTLGTTIADFTDRSCRVSRWRRNRLLAARGHPSDLVPGRRHGVCPEHHFP